MVRTTDWVVDILQRNGPGALPASRLATELRRSRPYWSLNLPELRSLVERSGERLLLLELPTDPVNEGEAPEPLDSWVILTREQDAPQRCLLSTLLWTSLSALASQVEPESRTSVSRWILHAERARRLCSRAAREVR